MHHPGGPQVIALKVKEGEVGGWEHEKNSHLSLAPKTEGAIGPEMCMGS